MGHQSGPEAWCAGDPLTDYKHLQMEQAHPDDGFALGPSLREHDAEELALTWTGTDASLGHMLAQSIEVPQYAYTISTIEDNVIHGVWGHGMWESGAVKAGMGYVWMLTDEILFRDHPLSMTSFARNNIFPDLDNIYPMYGNFVMSKNLVHCRWLAHSGFKDTLRSPINGVPFTLYLRKGNF